MTGPLLLQKPAQPQLPPRPDPVTPGRDGSRLNLGCGLFHSDGWINVDIDDNVEPDQVMDARRLAYPDQSMSAVYLGHVLHHMPYGEMPAVLAECRRVLEPGGEICVVGPDLARMRLGSAVQGPDPTEMVWPSRGVTVFYAMVDTGFDATLIDIGDWALDGWPLVSRVAWQYAIVGRKPEPAR